MSQVSKIVLKVVKIFKIQQKLKIRQICQKLSICQKFSKIVEMVFRSCLLITLIKCLKGHKSLGSLCNVKIKKSLSESVSEWVSEWVTRSPIELFWTAKNAGFLYQNEISPVLYDFQMSCSWPALPCGLYKPVISTSQGCISDVFAVPKCPQRNKW